MSLNLTIGKCPFVSIVHMKSEPLRFNHLEGVAAELCYLMRLRYPYRIGDHYHIHTSLKLFRIRTATRRVFSCIFTSA